MLEGEKIKSGFTPEGDSDLSSQWQQMLDEVIYPENEENEENGEDE